VRARGVEESPRFVSPGARVRHPDSRRHGEAHARSTRAHVKWRFGQVAMVELARDLHRPRKSTGTVEPSGRVDAVQRLTGAYQNGVTMASAATRDIEAMVQTVNEKHIRVPFFAQERPRPIGQAGASVTRQVRGAAVGLGLDDPSDEHATGGSPLVDEQTAHESSRQDKGVAGVPRARLATGPKRSGVIGQPCHGADVTRARDRRRRRNKGPVRVRDPEEQGWWFVPGLRTVRAGSMGVAARPPTTWGEPSVAPRGDALSTTCDLSPGFSGPSHHRRPARLWK
jgi:hypothetical protein